MNDRLNAFRRLSLKALLHRTGFLDASPQDWTLERIGTWQVSRDGELQVGAAAVWLTVHGQLDDWVLQPGESVRLRRGQRAAVEPWRAATVAQLQWQPQAALIARPAAPSAGVLRGLLAWGLGRLSATLAAWSQGTEALARRMRPASRCSGATCSAL